MDKEMAVEKIESKIFQIRGKKVMLDIDLARLYHVPTKVLNQAVKRNIKRFPDDFMIRLTEVEKKEVVTNCDHLNNLKFSPNLPYAFTEQGVAMLFEDMEKKYDEQFLIVFAAIKKLIEPPEKPRRMIGFHANR